MKTYYQIEMHLEYGCWNEVYSPCKSKKEALGIIKGEISINNSKPCCKTRGLRYRIKRVEKKFKVYPEIYK